MKLLTTRQQESILAVMNAHALTIISERLNNGNTDVVDVSQVIIKQLYEAAETLMGQRGVDLVHYTTNRFLKEKQDELQKEMESGMVHSESDRKEGDEISEQD